MSIHLLSSLIAIVTLYASDQMLMLMSYFSIAALIEREPKHNEPPFNSMMRLMYRQCMNQSKYD